MERIQQECNQIQLCYQIQQMRQDSLHKYLQQQQILSPIHQIITVIILNLVLEISIEIVIITITTIITINFNDNHSMQ